MTVLVVLLLVALAAALVVLGRVLTRLRTAQVQVDHLQSAVSRAGRQRADATHERNRLTLSLAAIEHGIVIVDERGDVVYRNDAAAAYLSPRHGDILVEEAITALARMALKGRSSDQELEVFGPPRRVLSLRAVPLDDPAAPAGALVVVEDSSDRRRLENVRRDFVANISHELKTPVGALSLLAETLLGEDDPQVMRRLAERISSEAFRVGHTIDDLLELSRIEVSAAQPSDTVLVATFVYEAVERVRPAAEQQEITLEVEEVAADLRVRGDRRQLVSAITNLLDNAVKYSEPDSIVEVRARAGDGHVVVEVRDYGIGIPRRDLERVFERFYRVDRARSRDTGGTGLGLAIVRHVASNHRGEVRVESREGEGSLFSFRLPAAPTEPVDDDRDDDSEAEDEASDDHSLSEEPA